MHKQDTIFICLQPNRVSVKFLMWMWVYEKGFVQAYFLPTCLISQDCDIFSALFRRSCIFVFRTPFSLALKLVLRVSLFPALFLTPAGTSAFVGSFLLAWSKVDTHQHVLLSLRVYIVYHSSRYKLFVNTELFLWWVTSCLTVCDGYL